MSAHAERCGRGGYLTPGRVIAAWATLCLIATLQGLAEERPVRPGLLVLGDSSQLFVDDALIESSEGVELVINPPQKKGRVLLPERPWEAYRVFVTSVLQDGDVYRMYYSCMPLSPVSRGGTITCAHCGLDVRDDTVICPCGWCPSEATRQRMFGNVAYAESRDGVHWEKPDLGQKEFDGSSSNNLIRDAGCIVSALPRPLNGMRFLSLAEDSNVIKLTGSADGKQFRIMADGLSPFIMDTTNQIMWDPNQQKYVAYLRGFPGRRVVVRAEMADPTAVPWPHNKGADLSIERGSRYVTTEMPTVMDGEALRTHEIYNPSLNVYPDRAGGVYLAFPTVYRAYQPQPDRPGHNYNKVPNDGMAEIYLLVSRDGKRFSIPARTAYVRPGTEGEPDRGYLSMAVGIIDKGDELWQYYTGTEVTHGVVDPGERKGIGGAYLLVQKRDRFVGARAGHDGGEVVTPPLVFSGNRLEINVDCGGLGEAWVEITDVDGTPVPGFAMAESDVVDMNHIHARCGWMTNQDVGRLAGRPVKLRFRLRAATLYAFRFFTDGDTPENRATAR